MHEFKKMTKSITINKLSNILILIGFFNTFSPFQIFFLKKNPLLKKIKNEHYIKLSCPKKDDIPFHRTLPIY